MCYYIGARKKETKKKNQEVLHQNRKGGTVQRSKYSDPGTRSKEKGNTPEI